MATAVRKSPEASTAEGTGEPCILPEGELSFVLTLNPATGEFGLHPIEVAAPNLSVEDFVYDFHQRDNGQLSRVSDETWDYYATKVGEILRAGKEVLTPLGEETSILETILR